MNIWQDPPGLVRPTERRRETTTSLRSFIPWLRRERLFDKVHAAISPAAAAVLAHPPLPTSWIDSTLTDEIFDAVAALRGNDAVTAMSLTGLRESLGFVVRPIVSMLMKISGATPSSVLAHLPTITTLFIKGVAFCWTSLSPDSGELVIAYEKPIPGQRLPRLARDHAVCI